jgi:hypothetical protein
VDGVAEHFLRLRQVTAWSVDMDPKIADEQN